MSVSGTTAVLLFLFFTSILSISNSSPLPVNASGNVSVSVRQRTLDNCGTGNPVDDCWRCDPGWADNRQRLADCAIGFGRSAIGGKNGRIYVVTDLGDDEDPANPANGTLRYGLAQDEPLWIIFGRDMTIRPKQQLLVSSHKTVDGRGANVVVGEGGACFTVFNQSNVIIHGITIRNCRPKPKSAKKSDLSDGDGVTLFGARDVWVDRCTLAACTDGLVDVIAASTGVTVSNCLMTNHDKAMLLGHNDAFSDDKGMRVTVAFNRFGPGLVQRMPRCRFGLFHVINNDYVNWEKYAIGGSASPTILSQGNRFSADNEKEVSKRDGDPPKSEWQKWNWISVGDQMLNGAFFPASGRPGPEVKAPSFAKSSSFVAPTTASAGALACKKGSLC